MSKWTNDRLNYRRTEWTNEGWMDGGIELYKETIKRTIEWTIEWMREWTIDGMNEQTIDRTLEWTNDRTKKKKQLIVLSQSFSFTSPRYSPQNLCFKKS